ncbi:vicianin hydrolase-like [Neltuma alba]|uniref:vicianin hydrolase-like n=1 Tax=Neltuma alba TaxID=207710 RepID=UPI0010A2CC17|nr:vicianin hydrolase-like [Prosopis alba]
MRVEGGRGFRLCVFLVATATTLTAVAGGDAKPRHFSVPFNRTVFPSDFVFGAGSAAYQSEGAANIDGRGPSIWDTFTKQHPGKISDHSTGAVADDFYHRYKSEIQLMKKIGLDSFRFSISWSRIFPEGKGKVNELGVKFYNNVINELLANGLTPLITLFHWDLPQALEDEYGGFCSPKVVMAHHLLLSHAAAVKLYKTKFQATQKGKIGITLVTIWFEPKSETMVDHAAANRALDFFFGWYADPITYGDYPKIMRSYVGDRLPKFTKPESEMLKGSYDFLGVNYYTTYYAENSLSASTVNRSYTSDMRVTFSTKRNGLYVGTPTALNWLYIAPKGIYQLMMYVKEKYQNPPIDITENGVPELNNASKPVQEAIKDSVRIRYHDNHLRNLLQAIKDGVNVKGYYAWSFFDDFEWDAGYTVRFGITYVDFKDNLKRYMKYSAYWLKMFLLH